MPIGRLLALAVLTIAHAAAQRYGDLFGRILDTSGGAIDYGIHCAYAAASRSCVNSVVIRAHGSLSTQRVVLGHIP